MGRRRPCCAARCSPPGVRLGPGGRWLLLAVALLPPWAPIGPATDGGPRSAPTWQQADRWRLLEEARRALDRGEPAIARRLLEDAARIEPDDAEILHLLGIACARAADPEAAAAAFERAVLLDPHRPDSWYNLGALRLGSGALEAAAEAFSRALALREDDVPARYQLGTTLLRLRRWAEAAGVLAPLEAALPGDAEVQYSIGFARLRAGQPASALEPLERARRQAPDSAAVLAALGAAREALGRRETAREAYEQALRLDPGTVAPRRGLARLAAEAGDYPTAMAQLERAARLAPGDVAIREELLGLYFALGLADRAAAVVSELLASAPDHPATHYWNGRLAAAGLAYRQAAAAFARAEELGRPGADIFLRHARALRALGDPEGAAQVAQRGLRRFPDDPDLVVLLGAAREEAGDVGAARSLYEGALERHPDDGDILYALGRLELEGGRIDRAVDLLRRAAERSADPAVLYALGQALLRRGERQAATAVLGRFEELRQREAELSSDLLATRQRYEEAVRGFLEGRHGEVVALLRGLTRTAPSGPAFLLMGISLLRLGRPDEAVDALLRAAELMPSAPAPQLHLAEAYRRMGRTEAAAAADRRYRQLKGAVVPGPDADET